MIHDGPDDLVSDSGWGQQDVVKFVEQMVSQNLKNLFTLSRVRLRGNIKAFKI